MRCVKKFYVLKYICVVYKNICRVKLALWDTSYFLNGHVWMCRVCSGALWILQSIAILYEPAHEITVLVRLSCNEGSDEPVQMRMLARVPPKVQGEVRLTFEKEYRIATETHILRGSSKTLWQRPHKTNPFILGCVSIIFTYNLGYWKLNYKFKSFPCRNRNGC